ncbi:MAG: C-terminal binding protein [Chloroflexota bacterium]|nr:MAG: C-terminal binding protein [Chloroflexota bacterium]
MGIKVAITIDLPEWLLDKRPLEEFEVQFIKRQCNNEDEVAALASDADAVICGFEPFTRRVMESMSQCKIIAVEGTGYQGVDVRAATDLGIIVTNIPDYCTEEVSDHVMAMILAMNRRLFLCDRITKAGNWGIVKWRTMIGPVSRLRGQTLGIIGLGKIARALVPKAQGFGLNTIACDPYIEPGAADKLGVRLVDLNELLSQSDFVSIHALLTPENRHMLGPKEFQMMKPTAYLVNTARGGLIDEQALAAALSQGLIAGAALDVTDPEPPSLDNPLFQMDNVLITPHSAQFSEAAMAEMIRRPAEEIARVLQGSWPVAVVNPEVKARFEEKWRS